MEEKNDAAVLYVTPAPDRDGFPRRCRRARVKCDGRVDLDRGKLVLYRIANLQLALFSAQTSGQEPRPDYRPRPVQLPASLSYGRARYT